MRSPFLGGARNSWSATSARATVASRHEPPHQLQLPGGPLAGRSAVRRPGQSQVKWRCYSWEVDLSVGDLIRVGQGSQ